MHESKYPTFRLGYKQAISGTGSAFSLAELGIKQIIEIGNWSMFRYSIAMGSFLKTSTIAFPDYHHMNSQPQAVMIGTYFDSFQLLDYYKYSCTGNFIEIQTQYRSQLLLLKRLPIISDRIWSENIFLRYANNNQLHNFIEAGYSLGNIFGLANVGIFVAYENFRYRTIGLKLCLGIDRIR